MVIRLPWVHFEQKMSPPHGCGFGLTCWIAAGVDSVLCVQTDETEAKDKATHKAIMEDTSIRVPGVIQVFEPPQVNPNSNMITYASIKMTTFFLRLLKQDTCRHPNTTLVLELAGLRVVA